MQTALGSTITTVVERIRQGRLESNHDIERAVRRAYLLATHYVCQAYLNENKDTRNLLESINLWKVNSNPEIVWIENVINSIKQELESRDQTLYIKALPQSSKLARVLLLDSQSDVITTTRFDELQQEVRTSIRQILDDEFGFYQQNCPEQLRTMLDKGWTIPETQSHADWFKLVCAFFAHEIKTNSRLKDILNSQILAGLSFAEQPLTAIQLQNELYRMSGMVSERIEQLTQNMYAHHVEVIDRFNQLESSIKEIKFQIQQPGSSYRAPTLEALQDLQLFGRSILIDTLSQQLRQQLLQDKAAQLVLVGMGGVGKTALALALANALKADFPDGQLLLRVRGLMQNPIQLDMHLRRELRDIIRRLSPGSEPPEDMDALIRSYQQVLTGRRVLLIADDVSNVIQIRLLMPPQGCALVVTTRIHPGAGYISHPLKSLAAEDACDLLRYLIPDISPDMAQEVTKLCEGLPLALRVASAYLNSSEAERERYLVGLRKEQRRLSKLQLDQDSELNVPAAIQLSYDMLPSHSPELAYVLRCLSIAPDSFDSTTAHALIADSNLDIDASDIDMALLKLQNYSLLERVQQDGRYDLHTIVRLFGLARLRSTTTEYETVRLRFVRYYCDWVDIANKELKEQPQQIALAKYDQEHANWFAALQFAIETHDVEHMLSFATQLWAYWHMRSWISEGRRMLNAIISAITPQDVAENHVQEHYAQILKYNGGFALYQNDYDEAIKLFSESLAIWRYLGNQKEIGNTLSNLGWALTDRKQEGDLASAAQVLQEALESFTQIDFKLGIAVVFDHMGILAREQGHLQEALALFHKSLALYRQEKDQLGWANASANVASIQLYSANPLQALQSYNYARSLFKEIEDSKGIMKTYEGQGWALLDLQNPSAASEAFLQGLKAAYSPEIQAIEVMILCLEGLTDVAIASNDYECALQCLGSAAGLRTKYHIQRAILDQPRQLEREAALQTQLTSTSGKELFQKSFQKPQLVIDEFLNN